MRNQAKLKLARDLRRNSTMPEQKLWEQLRNRNCGEFKFLRQVPIGPYIADFVCREKKLVIELDGWTHSTPDETARDASRSSFLKAEGYRVIRFGNESAMQGMDGLPVLILEELGK